MRQPRVADVVALSYCRLLMLPRDAFRQFLRTHPELMQQVGARRRSGCGSCTSPSRRWPKPERAVSRETALYLPMQNVAKIRSSTSSTPTAPRCGRSPEPPAADPPPAVPARHLPRPRVHEPPATSRRLGDRVAVPRARQSRGFASRDQSCGTAAQLGHQRRDSPPRSGTRRDQALADTPGNKIDLVGDQHGARIRHERWHRIGAVDDVDQRDPPPPLAVARAPRPPPRSDRRSRAGRPCRAG